MKDSIHSDALELARLLEPSWPALDAELDRSGTPTCKVAEPDAKLKDKLKEVEAAITDTRDERAEAIQERDSARDTYAGSDLSTDSDEFKTVQEAVAKVGELDDQLANLQSQQVTMLKLLKRDDEVARLCGHERPSGDPSDPRSAAWNSEAVLSDEDVRRTLMHMSTSKAQVGPVQIGEVASREALTADITGSANMRRGDYYGVLPQLRRMLTVLDLLPTATMDGNSIPYTEESGDLDDGTAETAEGDAKPEGGWTPTDKEASAKTIATWQKIRKQVLSDFPALQGIIDTRLRYKLERRVEKQVLNGNGTDPNLRGILNTSGIGAVAFDGAELPADQVLVGITTVLLADALADGIVMHPLDWADALKRKASGGDEQYYSGGPFSVTPQVLWGLPAVPSKAIPQGTVLVGDFAIGATLFIREGVNVLLSDSDQDDFIRNKVTLLAEMRAALPVWRPPAFATVDLTA